MEVVAATCDWREVLRTVSTLGPDVVVLDADLDPNGADHGLVRDLKRLTAARVVLLGDRVSGEAVMRYMLGGVEPFVHRDEQPQRLLTALRDVVVGRHDWFLGSSSQPDAGHVDHTLVDRLTVREQEVLQLMSERMTNGEISDRLGISTQTAKNYSSRVLQKLGLRRRSELTQLFVAPRKRAG